MPREAINTRQLEAFRAVIEDGTVSGAARRLRISQPAVSKLISTLERTTGLVLFHRAHQRLTPTAEAGLLYEEAERLFVGVERIRLFASEIRSLATGKLTLVGLPAIGYHVLPRAIARYVEGRPAANVTLQVQTSPRVVDWVTAQQVDLGISILPVDHPAVAVERLVAIGAMCVLPVGHHLAGRRNLKPADLRGEKFISLASNDRVRHMIDRTFDEAGISRRLGLDTHLSEIACQLVASGAGVSIVDPFTALSHEARGALVARSFHPTIRLEFYLLFPAFRPRSMLLRDFVTVLREEVARSLAGLTERQSTTRRR